MDNLLPDEQQLLTTVTTSIKQRDLSEEVVALLSTISALRSQAKSKHEFAAEQLEEAVKKASQLVPEVRLTYLEHVAFALRAQESTPPITRAQDKCTELGCMSNPERTIAGRLWCKHHGWPWGKTSQEPAPPKAGEESE